MKKLYMALFSFLMLCFVPMMVACNNNNASAIYRVKVVEFTEERVALSVDSDPYQLMWEIEDNVAENQKVTFTSSNTNVATVDENGKVTPVSPGTTVISVKSDDNPKAKTNTCTVKVMALKQTLSTPNNLRYLADTHEITWDVVVDNVAGDLIAFSSSFVPKYELSITVNGETEKKIVSSNVFDELDAGKAYSVTVKALGNQYLYNDSLATEALNVHIMGTPTKLNITPSSELKELQNKALMNDDYTTYTNRQYEFSFELPADASDQIEDYDFIFLNSNLELVTGSARDAFDVLLDEAIITPARVFKMPLDTTIPSGDYFIRVRAKGDSASHSYDGEYANIRFKMLPSPTNLVLSGDNKQMLTWNSVSYATGYKVVVEYKYTALDTDYCYATYYIKSGQETGLLLDGLKDKNGDEFLATEYHRFNIYLYALGDDTGAILDSAISPDTARAQLSQVKRVRLMEARTSADAVKLTWNPVANAGTYRVDIYNGSALLHSQNVDTNQFEIQTDASYLVVGTNTIRITAMPAVDQNYTKSVASDDYVLVKLATPTVSANKGIITWTRVNDTDSTKAYRAKYMRGDEFETVYFNNNQTSYDFSANVLDSGNYTDFTITACGSSEAAIDNIYLDSNPTSQFTVTKLALPNKLTVQEGVISMSDVRFDTFELKVRNTNTKELLYNVNLATQTMDTQIANIIKGLSPNVNYTFSVVAMQPADISDDTLYVKSNITDTIVYISEAVTDITSTDGVVTWSMPDSLFNLVKLDVSGSDTLNPRMLNNLRYKITNDQNTDIKYVGAVDAGVLKQTAEFELANIADDATVKVNIQMQFTNANNPTICILNSAVASKSFVQLKTPELTDITEDGSDWVLRMPKSNIAGLMYDFDVKYVDTDDYTRNSQFTLAATDLADDDTGYYHKVILTSDLLRFGLGSGTYTITVTAYMQGDGTYLISKKSNAFTFVKLAAPTLFVDDGVVMWDVTGGELALLTYNVKINGSDPYNINNSYYDISSNDYAGVVKISVQAKSNTSNIISSDYSRELNVCKLDSNSIVDNVLNSDTVEWTYAPTVNIDGNDEPITLTKFAYAIKPATNLNTILASGEIEVSESGKYTYTMPNNSTFGTGAYVLEIYPLGDSVTTELENVAGYINGNVYTINIYKLPQVNDLTTEQNKLVWTAGSIDNINGANISSTDLIYNIKIGGVESLKGYTYVARAGATDQKVVADSDESNGLYVRELVLSGDNKFYVPLQKQVYTDSEDDGGLVQNIRRGAEYLYNYLEVGKFNVIMYSSLSGDRTKTVNGIKYYLFDSNPYTISNITLLDAPNVQFENGVMTWSNQQTNFDKIEFTFDRYTMTGGELVPDGVSEKKVYTSYNKRDFDLSNLFDNSTSGKYYILKAQSIGNNKKIISSRVIFNGCAITNIPDIKINTDTGDDISAYNGWFVNKGAISWNAIDGAYSYILRFEQVKIDGGTETIQRTDYVTITDNGNSSYTYIPDNSLNVNGTYYLTMRAVGNQYLDRNDPHTLISQSGERYMAVFANSKYVDDNTAKHKLQQLTQNNTMKVKNGELQWENKESERDIATGYNVTIVNATTNSTSVEAYYVPMTSAESIDLTFQTFNKDTSQYYSRIQTLGVTWKGSTDDSIIYLTSQYGDSFAFRYIDGDDIKLNVNDGLFGWNLAEISATAWNAYYSIGLTSVEGGTTSWLTRQTQTTNNLENYNGQSIYSLAVKVIGTDDSLAQDGIPVLNSKVSSAIYNLQKLPNFANYVGSTDQVITNEIGDIVWNYMGGTLDAAQEVFRDAITAAQLHTLVSVSRLDGQTMNEAGSVSTPTVDLGVQSFDSDVTFNYETTMIDNATYSPYFRFSVSVIGSADYRYPDANAITYLSSNPAIITKHKYSSVSNFRLNDNIILSWDADTSYVRHYQEGSVELQKPDMLMIEYVSADKVTITSSVITLDNDAQFEKIAFPTEQAGTKINNIAQFLPNGSYILKLSAYSSEGSVFRSAPVYCEYYVNNQYTRKIDFDGVFEGLHLIDNVPYFGISTEAHLHNMHYVLDSNVIRKASEKTITGTTEKLSIYNISKGANYTQLNDITLSVEDIEYDNLHDKEYYFEDNVLFGIYDGNNYAINNISTSNGNLAWFDIVENGAVVRDVTLRYCYISVSSLGSTYSQESGFTPSTEDVYFGLLANTNYGLISGCTVIGRDDGIFVGGYFNNTNNLILGMLVGQNLSKTLTGDVVVSGKIVNCNNGINILPTYKNANNSLVSTLSDGQKIMLGGIAGLNQGASIIGCNNGMPNNSIAIGTLTGFRVGGIAYMNSDNGIISGCTNRGTLYAITTIEDGTAGVAGIVCDNIDSQVIYCINKGNIEVNALHAQKSYNNVDVAGIVARAYADGTSGYALVANCLQTYTTGTGIHVSFSGGESNDAWNVINIGYIIGQMTGEQSTIISDTVYKVYESDPTAARYYAQTICGNREDTDFDVTVVAMSGNTLANVNSLNTCTIANVLTLRQDNGNIPVFAYNDGDIVVTYVDALDYEAMTLVADKSQTLSTDNAFVIDALEDADILYTVEYYDTSALEYVDVVPTVAGDYTVRVTYYVELNSTQYIINIAEYTYTLTE